ncbi:uncharacterized protein METZ01_LOCUS114864 [marine metagenome]|uniref:Uncharacterized protein n=1 Tax=marine metagenome TaxID=408172 RepID=A0A381XBN1_9ZZZZ
MAKRPGVGGLELLDRLFPIELRVKPLVAKAAHPLAFARIVERLGNRLAKRLSRVLRHIARGIAGRETSLLQVEHHLRLSESHVLEHLVHRAVIVVRVDRVARYAEIHRPQCGE